MMVEMMISELKHDKMGAPASGSSDGFGKLVMMVMMLRMERMFVGVMWAVKMMMGAMVC